MHSTIDNTVHSRPLNSLEHCICTTLMTHIRPGRDSNPVPSFEPQLDRMIHRGRPILYCQQLASPRECVLKIIKLIRSSRRAPAEQFTGLTRGYFSPGPGLLNLLRPHDALKHHSTSLKTYSIFLQLRVLERKCP